MSLSSWFLTQSPRQQIRYALLGIIAALSILLFLTFYIGMGLTYYYSPMRTNQPGKVVILTTSWCPFCALLKKALAEARFPYREIDVEQDWKTEYAHYSTRRNGIPVTVIGSEVVGGSLDKQLQAIREICERQNLSRQYDCAKLVWSGRPSPRQPVSID